MWAVEEGDHCPACGSLGWLHTEKVEPTPFVQRAAVIKNVTELEAELRHLRQVVAEQVRHHNIYHPYCEGLPEE
jgi:hypothetical protein